MTRSGDTIDTPPDEDQLANLFAAVSVTEDHTSAPSVHAPQVLFSEGKVNEGGQGFSLHGNEGDVCSVLCFPTSDDINHVCAGFISGDTSRFCIKPPAGSRLPNSCTTMKHNTEKFQIGINRCYIVKNQTSAYSTPDGDISHLNPPELLQLQNEERPISHWQQFYTLQTNAKIKAEFKDVEDTKPKLKLLDKKLIL